eukprot:88934-Rhodomonas_salina.1
MAKLEQRHQLAELSPADFTLLAEVCRRQCSFLSQGEYIACVSPSKSVGRCASAEFFSAGISATCPSPPRACSYHISDPCASQMLVSALSILFSQSYRIACIQRFSFLLHQKLRQSPEQPPGAEQAATPHHDNSTDSSRREDFHPSTRDAALFKFPLPTTRRKI